MSRAAARFLLVMILATGLGTGTAAACTTCLTPLSTLPAPRAAFQTISDATSFSCPSVFYAIPLRQGQGVVFTLCPPGSSVYDSRLRLRRSNCAILSDNDDSCGLASQLTLPSVPETGTWIVEVTGFTTSNFGPFTLAWRGIGEGTAADECSNGVDDDGDRLTDCADAGCTDDVACPEWCTNGIDDDADSLVDCDDPECSDDPACPEACTNAIDDDANGLTDCADPECVGAPACIEAGQCGDGEDDDLDGWADCLDEECFADVICAHVVRTAETRSLRARKQGADVVLSWEAAVSDMAGAVDRPLSFDAWRGDDPRFVPDAAAGTNRIASGSGPSFARDAGAVTDGGTHFYLVTETGVAGRPSNARPAAVSVPGLTATWTAARTILLQWTASIPASRVAGYSVYRGSAARRYGQRLDAGLATSLELAGLEPDTWHHFAVTATDMDGNETTLSNDAVQAVLGTGVVRVLRDAPVMLFGPAAEIGWEPRALARLPDDDWVSATLLLTVDAALAQPCDCAGAGACGGDEQARPLTVFAVMDGGCVDSPETCLSWDEPQLQLLRAVTPSGTDLRTGPRTYSHDVTPLREALRGDRVFGVHLPTWIGDGWRVSLSLRISTNPALASPTPPAAGVAPLFLREGISADNQSFAAPARVTIPEGVTRVVARLFVSGHGASDPGSRPECSGAADEFCRKSHRLLVNGVEAWGGEVWRACAASCIDWNACGGASCALSRAGGCPGEITSHSGTREQDIDVTSSFPPGDHEVEYLIADPTPGAEWGYGVTLFWYR